jgi:hypothetical protein
VPVVSPQPLQQSEGQLVVVATPDLVTSPLKAQHPPLVNSRLRSAPAASAVGAGMVASRFQRAPPPPQVLQRLSGDQVNQEEMGVRSLHPSTPVAFSKPPISSHQACISNRLVEGVAMVVVL